jgi:CotH kinase protein
MTKQELCDLFYAMSNVVTIRITMPAADWDALRNAEPYGPFPGQVSQNRCTFEYTGSRYDWFHATSVEISGSNFPLGGPQTFTDVGIKKRSFCGSFSKSKPNLGLSFAKYNAANENVVEDLIGTQYISLNNSRQDASFIRQGLGYELFRLANLPHSRCNFAKVYVNGNLIGVYVNVEPIKKRYLQNNFGNDKGNLYEVEAGEDFTQAIMNSNRIGYEGFSSFTDKKDLKLATTTMVNEGAVGLSKVIDTIKFLRYFSMEALLKHWDGFTINLNNTYLYNDVVAVANPTTANVNFKFIPWGLDQILVDSGDLAQPTKFTLSPRSVPGNLVLNDPQLLIRLRTEIRRYANTIFSRENYENVLRPFVNTMRAALAAAGETGRDPQIDTVLRQLRIVRSAGLQLIGEVPLDAVHVLDYATDQCAHASHVERIGEHYEAYHRNPALDPSDQWYVVRSYSVPAHKLVNRKWGTYLHASTTVHTAAGHLNAYSFRHHPNDGNYWEIEYLDAADPRAASGLYVLKSRRTGLYLHYSATDLTPLGRKQLYQGDRSIATVLHIQ